MGGSGFLLFQSTEIARYCICEMCKEGRIEEGCCGLFSERVLGLDQRDLRLKRTTLLRQVAWVFGRCFALVICTVFLVVGCADSSDSSGSAAPPTWFAQLTDTSRRTSLRDQSLRTIYEQVLRDPKHVEVLRTQVSRLNDTQVLLISTDLVELAKAKPDVGYLEIADEIERRVPWASADLVPLYSMYQTDYVWARLLKIATDCRESLGIRLAAMEALCNATEVQAPSAVVAPLFRVVLSQQETVVEDALLEIGFVRIGVCSGVFPESDLGNWLSRLSAKYPSLSDAERDALRDVQELLAERTH